MRFSATLSLQTPEQAYTMLDGAQLAQLGKEAYENAGMSVPAYFQDPKSVVTRTNWLDEIFRTAITQNYQVNFGGGSKKVTYNFSAGYFNQEGILINTDFNRYTFRGQRPRSTSTSASAARWVTRRCSPRVTETPTSR